MKYNQIPSQSRFLQEALSTMHLYQQPFFFHEAVAEPFRMADRNSISWQQVFVRLACKRACPHPANYSTWEPKSCRNCGATWFNNDQEREEKPSSSPSNILHHSVACRLCQLPLPPRIAGLKCLQESRTYALTQRGRRRSPEIHG